MHMSYNNDDRNKGDGCIIVLYFWLFFVPAAIYQIGLIVQNHTFNNASYIIWVIGYYYYLSFLFRKIIEMIKSFFEKFIEFITCSNHHDSYNNTYSQDFYNHYHNQQNRTGGTYNGHYENYNGHSTYSSSGNENTKSGGNSTYGSYNTGSSSEKTSNSRGGSGTAYNNSSGNSSSSSNSNRGNRSERSYSENNHKSYGNSESKKQNKAQGSEKIIKEIRTRADALAVLELESFASEAEIKRAYLTLMKKYHPDRLKAKGITGKMKQEYEDKCKLITSAYNYLK